MKLILLLFEGAAWAKDGIISFFLVALEEVPLLLFPIVFFGALYEILLV